VFATITEILFGFVESWIGSARSFAAAVSALFGGLRDSATDLVDLWLSTFGRGVDVSLALLQAVGAAAASMGQAFINSYLDPIRMALDLASLAISKWIEFASEVPVIGPAFRGAQEALANLGDAFDSPIGLAKDLASAAGATADEFERLKSNAAGAATAGATFFEAFGPDAPGAPAAATGGAARAPIKVELDQISLSPATEEALTEAPRGMAAALSGLDLSLGTQLENLHRSALRAEIKLDKFDSDAFRESLDSGFGSLLGALGPVGIGISVLSDLPGVIQGANDVILGIFEGINEFDELLRTVLTDTLPTIISDLIPGILFGVADIIADLPGILIQAIPALVSALGEMLAKLLTPFGEIGTKAEEVAGLLEDQGRERLAGTVRGVTQGGVLDLFGGRTAVDRAASAARTGGGLRTGTALANRAQANRPTQGGRPSRGAGGGNTFVINASSPRELSRELSLAVGPRNLNATLSPAVT
jgi:hypothetical protein